MALTEAEELELLELENENAKAMGARPPDPAPRPLGLGVRALTAAAVPATLLAPGMVDRVGKSFLGIDQRPASGLGETVADYVGREGLQTGASMGAQLLAGGVGPQAALASGAAAGAATGLQLGARSLAKKVGYDAAAPESIGQAAGEVGKVAAITGAASMAIPPAVRLAGAGIREATKRTAGLISGVGGEAFERILARPKEVLKEIAEGPLEKSKEYAVAFKESIERNFDLAGQEYEEIIKRELLDNPAMNAAAGGKRFNLLKDMGRELADVQRDFGFGMPNRLGGAGAEADEFLRIKRMMDGMKNASAEELYYLQRDLGRIARDNKGTSLGASLSRVNEKMKDYLANRIPAIAKANEVYKPAKEMMVALEKQIDKIDDLPAKIKGAYERNTQFKDLIEKIAEGLPAARMALEGLRDSLAAKPFDVGIAQLPRTGLAAGVGATGVGAVTMNPVAIGTAAALSPFMFPRALAKLLAAGSKQGPKFAELVRSARPLTPAAATGLTDLMLERR